MKKNTTNDLLAFLIPITMWVLLWFVSRRISLFEFTLEVDFGFAIFGVSVLALLALISTIVCVINIVDKL